MNNIVIRKIKKNELDDLVTLCELHAIYENNTYDRNNKADNLKNVLFLENPPIYILGAYSNNILIAYCSFVKEYSTWNANYFLYMDCLYISEEHRGKGLGKSFFKEILNYKEKLNCTHIQWQTPIDNTNAIKFYENIGAISKDKKRFFLY